MALVHYFSVANLKESVVHRGLCSIASDLDLKIDVKYSLHPLSSLCSNYFLYPGSYLAFAAIGIESALENEEETFLALPLRISFFIARLKKLSKDTSFPLAIMCAVRSTTKADEFKLVPIDESIVFSTARVITEGRKEFFRFELVFIEKSSSVAPY